MSNEFRFIGPPGVGKSTMLRRQAESAVEEYGHDGVMVVTFTRTAAAHLRRLDLPVNSERVGTLHSQCYRALECPPIAEVEAARFNIGAPDWAMVTPQRRKGEDAWEVPVDEQTAPLPGDALLSELNRCRAKLIPVESMPDDVQAFAALWAGFKREHGLIDFTDMIEIPLAAMECAPGYPGIILVDETQDLTPMQLSLLRKWGERAEKLILFFDDDQQIYSWLGAEPQPLLEPIPADHVRFLNKGRRMAASIHRPAQEWIGRIESAHRLDKPGFRPREDEGVVAEGEVCLIGTHHKHPAPLVDELGPHLEAGRSVAILATCGYLLNPTLRELRERGIAYHNPYRPKERAWQYRPEGSVGSAVSVGTIHSYKGGEADVVALYTELSPSGYAAWKGWAGDNEPDSVIRQMYVGMTRARDTLLICEPATDTATDLFEFVDGLL